MPEPPEVLTCPATEMLPPLTPLISALRWMLKPPPLGSTWQDRLTESMPLVMVLGSGTTGEPICKNDCCAAYPQAEALAPPGPTKAETKASGIGIAASAPSSEGPPSLPPEPHGQQ